MDLSHQMAGLASRAIAPAARELAGVLLFAAALSWAGLAGAAPGAREGAMPRAAGTLSREWQGAVACVVTVAPRYNVPANVMLAIAEVEGGRPNFARRNLNGTLDYGPMQVNSIHLKEFEPYGITAQHLAAEGCYPFELATWMVARHLAECRSDDFWTCVANYHSKTPVFNERYRVRVIAAATKWARWFKATGPTVEYVGAR